MKIIKIVAKFESYINKIIPKYYNHRYFINIILNSFY